jgi:hypothetical protein
MSNCVLFDAPFLILLILRASFALFFTLHLMNTRWGASAAVPICQHPKLIKSFCAARNNFYVSLCHQRTSPTPQRRGASDFSTPIVARQCTYTLKIINESESRRHSLAPACHVCFFYGAGEKIREREQCACVCLFIKPINSH